MPESGKSGGRLSLFPTGKPPEGRFVALLLPMRIAFAGKAYGVCPADLLESQSRRGSCEVGAREKKGAEAFGGASAAAADFLFFKVSCWCSMKCSDGKER